MPNKKARLIKRNPQLVTKSGLQALRGEVKEIVAGAVDELTIIVGNSFGKIEKRFDKIDERFEKIDEKFEGVNNRIQGLWNAFDSHTLDCVRRDEYDRLEKRVRTLETA